MDEIPGELILESDATIGRYEALELAIQLMADREFELPDGDQTIFDLAEVATKCAEYFLAWLEKD